MQTVEHVYAQTQILNWLAKENGIACMPPYQYLVEGELWEVDVVSANNGGYRFAVGEYHAHGAEEVLQIMKREANKA